MEKGISRHSFFHDIHDGRLTTKYALLRIYLIKGFLDYSQLYTLTEILANAGKYYALNCSLKIFHFIISWNYGNDRLLARFFKMFNMIIKPFYYRNSDIKDREGLLPTTWK